MNAKPFITVLAVVAIGGVGYAAYRFYKRQADLLYDYEIKPSSFELISATPDKVDIKFTMRFTNKSSIEATIKELSTDIYLNDIFIGYVVNDTQAVIPAKGTSDIKLQASFSPALVFKNLVDMLLISASLKDVKYKLTGYAKLQSAFIPLSIPFENSGKLSEFL